MSIKSAFTVLLIISSGFFSSCLLAAEMSVDVSGTWSGVVLLENGQELPFGITLEQEGSTVNGVLTGIGSPDIVILNGRIENNILYFSSVRPIGGEQVPFDYIGVKSADYLNITIIRVGATGPNSVLSTMTRRQ
jgi:hypothetical protein